MKALGVISFIVGMLILACAIFVLIFVIVNLVSGDWNESSPELPIVGEMSRDDLAIYLGAGVGGAVSAESWLFLVLFDS